MQNKVTVALEGVPRLVRALQLTDAGTRERTAAAIRDGAQTVRDRARVLVPRRSGELAYSIRDEYTKDGLVGFVKAGYGQLLRRSRATTERGRARFERVRQRREANRSKLKAAPSSRRALTVADLGIYAPVVERGDRRRNKPARPFLTPAFRQERPNIAAAIQRAPLDAGRAAGLQAGGR